jgi:hypothetical protein
LAGRSKISQLNVKMSDDTTENWLKFLNPESLKQNLIRASIYLTCWEMLKECLLDQPRGFFSHEFRDGKWIVDSNYKTKVLSLENDPLIASATWFRDQKALSDEDIALLLILRTHRNEIAHELPKILGTVESDVRLDFLNGVYYLTEKADKWWIQNIEIPTNPEFDNREFSEEELNGVKSSRMISMSLLIAVANGQEDQLRWLYEEMKKKFPNG